MPDEELLALDRSELTELAQKCYDAEMESRQLTPPEDDDSGASFDEEPAGAEESDTVDPDWLESAVEACSFQVGYNNGYSERGEAAYQALQHAGVPCRTTLEDVVEGEPQFLRVMVPSALSLKASSVLDQEIFNPEMEETWRTHFEHLSDRDLHELRPEVVCAGLLDRAARLKRVYLEEVARRRAAGG